MTVQAKALTQYVSDDPANEATTAAAGDLLGIEVSGTPKAITKANFLKELTQGAGLTLLSTATISSDAVVDFTDAVMDNSTYTDYVIRLRNVEPATDGANLLMRVSNDGGSTFNSGASSYQYVTMFAGSGGGGAQAVTAVSSQIVLLGSVGNAAGEEGVSGTITIHNASSSLRKLVSATIAGRNSTSDLIVANTTAEAGSSEIDGLRLLFSTGNLASGEIALYGVR